MINFDAINLYLFVSISCCLIWSTVNADTVPLKREESDKVQNPIYNQLLKDLVKDLVAVATQSSLAPGENLHLLSDGNVDIPLVVDVAKHDDSNLEKNNAMSNGDQFSNLLTINKQNPDLNFWPDKSRMTTAVNPLNKIKSENSFFDELEREKQSSEENNKYNSSDEESMKAKNETLGMIEVTDQNDIIIDNDSFENTIKVEDVQTEIVDSMLPSKNSSDFEAMYSKSKAQQHSINKSKLNQGHVLFMSAIDSTELPEDIAQKQDEHFNFKKKPHKSKLSESDVYQILKELPNSYQKMIQIKKHEDNKLKAHGKPHKNDQMIRTLLKNVENFVGHVILKDMFDRYQQHLVKPENEQFELDVAGTKSRDDDDDLANVFIQLSNNNKEGDRNTLLKRILKFQY